MARTAEDLRLLFSALVGYEPQDPFSTPVPLRPPLLKDVRIGIWEQFYDVPVAEDIRAAVRQAAGMLQEIGFPVDEFAPQGLERAPNVWAFLFSQWPAMATRKLIEGREADAHWTLLENTGAKEVTAEQVLTNLASRDRLRASLLRQMESVPVLLMPVAGIKSFRHRERHWDIGGRQIGIFQALMPVVLANALGLPAVTIPMALSSEGLPIGVQLVGRPYEDELILELAVRLEELRGPFPTAPLGWTTE
jgi:Asp-tRNA(Asn)/Glu-tRNA(Gln) amidotransferase A subunit family amidase